MCENNEYILLDFSHIYDQMYLSYFSEIKRHVFVTKINTMELSVKFNSKTGEYEF